jgi:hypothetical protein
MLLSEQKSAARSAREAFVGRDVDKKTRKLAGRGEL